MIEETKLYQIGMKENDHRREKYCKMCSMSQSEGYQSTGRLGNTNSLRALVLQ